MFHRQLESHPLLIKMINQTITLHEYSAIIERFYGWLATYEPCCQQLCQNHLDDHDRLILEKRWHKTRLLEQDLLDLGYKRRHIEQLPKASLIDGMNDWLAIIGYLYVFEGATLGGREITQRLQVALGLGPNNGIHFFNSYGSYTQHMWRDFCYYLNNMAITKSEKQIIIAIAQQLFIQLYDWLTRQ